MPVYTIYKIQHQQTHETDWYSYNPKGELIPIKKDTWNFSCMDHFGRPLTEELRKEKSDVWQKTGKTGWWKLESALKVLKLLKEANEKGVFNYIDGYGKEIQGLRYKFKTVKVTYSTDVVEEITQDDLLEVI
jgi:hypothetical protein